MRLFSRTAAGRKKLVGAVDAFPWVQTEAQQDYPLEEICAGKPYRINRVASFADNLSGHAFPSLKRYTPILVRKQMSAIINDGPEAIAPVRDGKHSSSLDSALCLKGPGRASEGLSQRNYGGETTSSRNCKFEGRLAIFPGECKGPQRALSRRLQPCFVRDAMDRLGARQYPGLRHRLAWGKVRRAGCLQPACPWGQW